MILLDSSPSPILNQHTHCNHELIGTELCGFVNHAKTPIQVTPTRSKKKSNKKSGGGWLNTIKTTTLIPSVIMKPTLLNTIQLGTKVITNIGSFTEKRKEERYRCRERVYGKVVGKVDNKLEVLFQNGETRFCLQSTLKLEESNINKK